MNPTRPQKGGRAARSLLEDAEDDACLAEVVYWKPLSPRPRDAPASPGDEVIQLRTSNG